MYNDLKFSVTFLFEKLGELRAVAYAHTDIGGLGFVLAPGPAEYVHEQLRFVAFRRTIQIAAVPKRDQASFVQTRGRDERTQGVT